MDRTHQTINNKETAKKRQSFKSKFIIITVFVTLLAVAAVAVAGIWLYQNDAISNLVSIVVFASIGLAAALIIGFLLGGFVSKSLSNVLRRLKDTDEAFSRGVHVKIDNNSNPNCEMETLYEHYITMFSAFRMSVADIKDMSAAHLRGEDDVYLDESKFKGEMQALVKNVNDMVKMYHDDFCDLLRVMQSYGEGDLSANVAEYPGNWKWANDAVDTLRNSFVHLAKEINKIANHALKGEFHIQADVGDLKGVWASSIKKLNDFCEAVERPIKDIEYNVLLMSVGDFSPLQGEYHGHFKVLQDACNSANTVLQAHVDEISEVVTAMSKGDLTCKLKEEYVGDYAPIKYALTTILESLNGSMKDISETSKNVLSGAEVLLQSAEALAQGSNEQASAIEELNTSISLIQDKIQDNTSRANDADKLAQQSNEYAQRSNEKMASMLSSMEEIKGSSASISSIIKVIEGIAFQTNLLAINASVEAARAGVHGTGFSVVADEVGTLAQRSQGAAKESTGLINNSIEKVVLGGNFAQDVASTLNSIVTSVEEVSELVSQIAAISSQQETTINEISKGIFNISEVAHLNAVTSEECSSIATEFSHRAQSLMEMVSFYKLNV